MEPFPFITDKFDESNAKMYKAVFKVLLSFTKKLYRIFTRKPSTISYAFARRISKKK